MNAPFALVPELTVTQASDALSAVRPVNVLAHVFLQRDGALPPTMDDPTCACGPSYPILDRNAIEPHDHEHYEVSIVMGGRAVHRTRQYRMPLRRGDVIVIAPGQVHALDEIDGLHIIDCVYITEWLMHDASELWREPGVLPLFLGIGRGDLADAPWAPQHPLEEVELRECLQEMRCIERELGREQPSRPYLRRCIQKIMIVVGRALARDDEFRDAGPLPREVHLALERIEAEAVADRPFRVRELAEAANLSPNYFTRLFRESTGTTPMAYYQRRRVEHACWLLLNTDNAVTEIAYSLGYLDPPHFARVFRSHRGVSPREYRARYRSG